MKNKPTINMQQILDSPVGKLNPHLTPGKMAAQRKSKYGNQKVETEDGVFDSKKELQEWKKLRLRQRAGEIYGLSRQTEFLLPGGVIYRADFTFFERHISASIVDIIKGEFTKIEWIYTVMDAKGVRTDVYRIKKKQMKEKYGIDIVEV